MSVVVITGCNGRYGRRLSSVLHLAADYDFSGEPSPLYEQVTIRGTERLLQNLEALEVEQFVFASTVLVHAATDARSMSGEQASHV